MWTQAARNPFARLLAGWALVGLATAAAFGSYEWYRLGASNAQGAARLTAAIELAFAASSQALTDAGARVAGEAELVARAAADPAGGRELFATLEALRQADPAVSLTVYSPGGVPMAWSGRPSDLPRARTTGNRAMFVAPGPLGPRLVAVLPIVHEGHDASSGQSGPQGPVRVGAAVAERLLPTEQAGSDYGPPGETVVWQVSGVAVTLRARYQGAGADGLSGSFQLTAPDGTPLLEGQLRSEDVASARADLRRGLAGALLLLSGVCLTLVTAPLLGGRHRPRSARRFIYATLGAAAAVCGGRWLLWVGLPLVIDDVGSAAPGLVFRSGADFLLTAAAGLVLVAILANATARARRAWRPRRRGLGQSPFGVAGFVAACLAAGLAAAAVFAGVQALVRVLTSTTPVDVLSFSLHPVSPARLATEAALVLTAAAASWLATTVMLAALIPFRLGPSRKPRLAAALLWLLPGIAWGFAAGAAGAGGPASTALWLPTALAVLLASVWRPVARQFRHASQGARLILLCAALVAPVLAWYPGLFVESDRAKRSLVATRLAPQAIRQRDDLQDRVRRTLTQVDDLAVVPDLAQAGPLKGAGPIPTDAAFHVWSRTDLARFRVTSAVELYGPDGFLVSRFALKLPDYTSSQQRWEGSGCGWELFEEVSPFFSEERRLLYAGRGLCVETPAGSKVVGAIAIYAMLDYGDLPFISAQSPYLALLRGQPAPEPEMAQSRDVDFVVYGWSRRPVYASRTAWTLDDETFRNVYASREPFWTRIDTAERRYAVHLANDRGGIYALGYPTLTFVEHMVNAAELTALGCVAFVVLALAVWVTTLVVGSAGLSGRDLLREVRASFYRKLFLAFVAAAAVPVVTLAFVAQAYLTAQLRADVEAAAVRTTAVARRVVEDYALLQERGDRRVTTVDDDILVWIARLINQDVNVFDGPDLMATSERNLYASGVLPTRTSADVYRAIVLERRAASILSERVGWFDYLVASAPVRIGGREAILSVPLTLRQQAIEQEIDDLNRRILLAIVTFILGASALGYWMAERIADPVNRLQRATARIARGDLTARVALTSSDELRRLVEAFNTMAAELQRQQGQLERTHRLEAWADMARQVAHEIKNPLTPIQLSAEHLRRVHADRGTPLAPVLEGCVDSILTQVRLLRQIAAEFSSFASAPTPRPVETDLAELVNEVIEPYRAGLADRVAVHVDLASGLPRLRVDRTLIGRALTNVIDNALHAMPGRGRLTVAAAPTADREGVALIVTDTGVGMDAEAVARIFEPYFSTKATGTGLGLTIAKRNVELHGGTVGVTSAPGRGTTVTMALPRERSGPGRPPDHTEG